MKKLILSVFVLGFTLVAFPFIGVFGQIPHFDVNTSKKYPTTPYPTRPSPWNHPERIFKVMMHQDTANVIPVKNNFETNKPKKKDIAVKVPNRKEQ